MPRGIYKRIKRRKDRKKLRNYLMVIARDKDAGLVEKLPDASWQNIADCFKLSKQRVYEIYKEIVNELY